MTTVDPTDEGRHDPEGSSLWNESWYFDFASEDGTVGGYVRLGLYPGLGVSWFWAFLVGEGRPLVTVVDHEAPLPRGAALELRAEGLWTSLVCEEPLSHWSIGLEAFGVALDDPSEAYRSCRGDRTALGLDLEWETVGGGYGYPGVTRYEVPCRVHGQVLVGRETIAFDGWGERDHSWGTRDWWTFPWCWTAGRLGDGTMWHASRPRIEGVRYEPGFVLAPGGTPEQVDRFSATEVLGGDGLPTSAELTVGPLELAVEPRAFAPVRLDAPDGRISRLARALSRAEADDGRAGWCWMEWNQPQPPT